MRERRSPRRGRRRRPVGLDRRRAGGCHELHDVADVRSAGHCRARERHRLRARAARVAEHGFRGRLGRDPRRHAARTARVERVVAGHVHGPVRWRGDRTGRRDLREQRGAVAVDDLHAAAVHGDRRRPDDHDRARFDPTADHGAAPAERRRDVRPREHHAAPAAPGRGRRQRPPRTGADPRPGSVGNPAGERLGAGRRRHRDQRSTGGRRVRPARPRRPSGRRTRWRPPRCSRRTSVWRRPTTAERASAGSSGCCCSYSWGRLPAPRRGCGGRSDDRADATPAESV